MDFARKQEYYKARRESYKRPLPLEIAIELTPLCNQDCGFCFNRKSFFETTRHVGQLSTKEVKDIIDMMAMLDIPSVRFTGGEPLLRSDLFELMRYAKNKGRLVMLNTNATLIATKERAEKIVECVDSVLVSLITWDADKEEEITGMKRSMELRMQGIHLLLESSVKNIRLGTITTPENVEHFDDLLAMVEKTGIKTWELFRPVGVVGEEHALSKEQARVLIEKIDAMRSDVDCKITTAFPFCVDNPDMVKKHALGATFDDGHVRMIVDPRGFVKPSYPNDTNLGPASDILAAWEHPFLKDMHEGKFLPNTCKSCVHNEVCRGGNRYLAKLSTGKFDGEDPLMDVSFLRDNPGLE